jgi:hypothetical protein
MDKKFIQNLDEIFQMDELKKSWQVHIGVELAP